MGKMALRIASALLVSGSMLGAVMASNDIEVVVAHYNVDLTWIPSYANIAGLKFTVYSKGATGKETAVALPNVGRESHTYLTHIVNNYDQLAPWTVFTQGTGPAWGYRSGDSSSGHLTDNITFANYFKAFREGKDAFFAISAATHLPKGVQSTRLGILTNKLKAIFCAEE